MIETRGLRKVFGGTVAVDALSIRVREGEVFGFLGPNGAGKTTTIRMLAALIAPTAGQAIVAGCSLGLEDSGVRRRVGILTESPGLYDRLSAERNLDFFGRLYEVEQVTDQVERYLRLLGLWGRRGEAVGTFSRGMRKKLAIARVMLHEPSVLLLDEPTGGLDPEAARLVRDFIEALKAQGRTIFLCTHNLDEADRLCDRIAVFNRRLLALDSPGELRRQLFGRSVVFHLRAAEERFADLVRSFPFVRRVQRVENKILATVEDPESHNPRLVEALVSAGAEVQFVGELRRRLEEVYLQLLRNEGQVEKST